MNMEVKPSAQIARDRRGRSAVFKTFAPLPDREPDGSRSI